MIGAVRRSLRSRPDIGIAAVDQLLSSGSNVIVAVLVARMLDVGALGGYAVAFAVFALSVELSRSVGGEVLAIRIQEISPRDGVAAVASVATIVGFGAGVICLLGGALLSGPVSSALLMMGVFVVFSIVQDSLRNAFIIVGTPMRALVSDSIWLVAQVATLVWLAGLPDPSPGSAVTAWGLAALVSTLATVLIFRIPMSYRRAIRWLVDSRALWPRALGEAAISAGFAQVMLVMIAAIVGASEFGRLRAAQIVLGPASMAILLAPMLGVPEAARQRTAHGIRRTARLTSGLLVGISLVSGVVAMAVPDSVGRLVIGDNWDEAVGMIPYVAAMFAASGLVTGAMVGLRGARRVDTTLKLRSFAGPPLLVAAVVAATAGIAASAIAIVVTRLLLGLVAWRRVGEVEPAEQPSDLAVTA